MLKTILVTGAGGDVALSVIHTLREHRLAERIVGGETRERHAGIAFCDGMGILPLATDPSYFEALSELAISCQADVIIPMSEAELTGILQLRDLGHVFPAPLIMANDFALRAGLDKWVTYKTLSDAGISVPLTGVIGEQAPPIDVFIVKPRSGQGSKGIVVAEPWSVDHLLATRTGDIWQQFLPDAEQEYTCGLFRAKGTSTRMITLRRKLVGGLTGAAIVVEDHSINRMLNDVADALNLEGAVNVQLRIDNGIPYIFEINPRFSSTVGFRNKVGFEDVKWSLEAALGNPISDYVARSIGKEYFRVGTDVIL